MGKNSSFVLPIFMAGEASSLSIPSLANPISMFEFNTATSKAFSGEGRLQAVKDKQANKTIRRVKSEQDIALRFYGQISFAVQKNVGCVCNRQRYIFKRHIHSGKYL
jgi:hypothetical protein